MREIVYPVIAGNPYVKDEHKPLNSQAIFPLTDDKKVNVIKQKQPKQPTAEELEATRQELLNLMNKK